MTKKTSKAKQYKQKDLGYPRQPTDARIIVRFSDSETWNIPAQLVVDDRDEEYRTEKEDTAKFVAEKSLDEYAIIDWLSNNMNWSDVEEYAELEERGQIDRELEWGNAEKEYLA